MNYTLKSIKVKSYPVLELEFADGFVGELDLGDMISRGNIFEPLQDVEFFMTVKMDEYGYSFGWRIDEIGNEIDLSAEGARIDIETAIAAKTAATYHPQRPAAE
jgi:Protein of unknown function (DUF2442)